MCNINTAPQHLFSLFLTQARPDAHSVDILYIASWKPILPVFCQYYSSTKTRDTKTSIRQIMSILDIRKMC